MKYSNKYIDKNYFIKLDDLMKAIQKHDKIPNQGNAFNYWTDGINIKPHEIGHMMKIAWLKPLAKFLKDRQRETLLISLFAKAVCEVRGHVRTGKTGNIVKAPSKIRNHYMASTHMYEFREAFSMAGHYALIHKGQYELGLGLHYIEETENMELIVAEYRDLLAVQFNRGNEIRTTESHLVIAVDPRPHKPRKDKVPRSPIEQTRLDVKRRIRRNWKRANKRQREEPKS